MPSTLSESRTLARTHPAWHTHTVHGISTLSLTGFCMLFTDGLCGSRARTQPSSHLVMPRGVNSQGNSYNTPGGSNSNSSSYHYSNSNGSYYYANDNGSTYYSPPPASGSAPVYTPPPSK